MIGKIPAVIVARVAAGAAWLDPRYPGWERVLNLENLVMYHGCKCVLGQIIPVFEQEYNSGPGYNWAVWNRGLLSNEAAKALGFYTPVVEAYPLLERAWAELVKQRFDTGTLSG